MKIFISLSNLQITSTNVFTEVYIELLSAISKHHIPLSKNESLINMLNNKGPSRDPWALSNFTSNQAL